MRRLHEMFKTPMMRLQIHFYIIYNFNLTVFLFNKAFSIVSSCVRVDIDGVKSVYNCGEAFMIPSGE